MAKSKVSRNPKVAAALVAGDTDSSMPREKQGIDYEKLIGIASKVAGSSICVRFIRIPNAMEHFPHDPLLRSIDRFFPYADGGPLYVDEPQTMKDLKDCERKSEAMKKEGKRYTYIEPPYKTVDGDTEVEIDESVRLESARARLREQAVA